MHLTLESDTQYLLAAIYDGIPGDPNNPRGTHIQFNSGDGLFGALEWGWTPAGDKIVLGAWQHSAEVESVVTGNLIDSNSGIYLIAEKNINDIAAVFLQLGRADDQFNQLEYYAGTGVTFTDFWRTGDGLGIAVAQARNGDPYLAANTELQRAETAWELTYYSPLVNYLNAQASVYYIQHPAMDKTLDDALAIGARLFIEF